ncbi:Gfo/Idh/MocA family oxidoreductase [Nitrosopumilus sp. S4]
MKKICLVGCGNVGSRHLQAIAKLDFEIDVDIVEPIKDAIEMGKKRLDEIKYNDATHKFSWYKNIQELKDKPDLTIVATIATGRANMLCKLADMGHSRFLIEKMVCQSNKEYENILTKFHQKNIKAWINTNPRCFSSYQKLKEFFGDSKKIHFSVTASNVSALGTNAVHYMDLFSYFIDDYKIIMNGEMLIHKIFPNKRGSDLMEFAGMITGKGTNDSTISMSFLPFENLPTIVNIIGNGKHLLIDETNEKVLDMVNHENKKFSFTFEHASSITTKISKDILDKDSCGLTTLENSYILHKEIFRIFNKHITKITGKKMELCPIT